MENIYKFQIDIKINWATFIIINLETLFYKFTHFKIQFTKRTNSNN